MLLKTINLPEAAMQLSALDDPQSKAYAYNLLLKMLEDGTKLLAKIRITLYIESVDYLDL